MDSSLDMRPLNREILKILTDDQLKNLFLHAAKTGDTHTLLVMLTQNSALIKAKTDEGDTAFFLAVKHNHKDTVEWLATFDPQLIHTANKNGETPLMFAAGLGYTEIVAHLIKHGANIVQDNLQGENALTFAAKNYQDKIVFQLMEAVSPFVLPTLKQIPILKPFAISFELQTKVQGQRMTSTDLAISLEPTSGNELWEKPKTRARKKQVKSNALISLRAPELSILPESRSTNFDSNFREYGFKKADRRAMESDSWRSGSSALTFVAPVAVKKLDPRVSDFKPESPSSKSKKAYDLNFPPLSASESDSWKKDPAVKIKVR